jgi:hypothetical protein
MPNRLNQEQETSKKFVLNVFLCKGSSPPAFAEYCTAVQAESALRHRDVLRHSKF